MGAEVKGEGGVLVSEEEADRSLLSVEDIGAAARTLVHEVVPSSAPSRSLAMSWLSRALQKQPPTPDAPLFRGLLNSHVTLEFVVHKRCGLPSRTPSPLAPGCGHSPRRELGGSGQWATGRPHQLQCWAPPTCRSASPSRPPGCCWGRWYMRCRTTDGPSMASGALNVVLGGRSLSWTWTS